MKRARKVLENYQEITKKKMQNFLNRGNVPKKDRKVLGRYIPKSTKIKYWKSARKVPGITIKIFGKYCVSTKIVPGKYLVITGQVLTK